MQVGCIGDVAFEVSSAEIKTFSDFSWTSGANVSVHALAGGNSISEFTSSDVDKATLKILISEYLGSDPMSEYKILRGYSRKGSPKSLVIGDNLIGGKWLITQAKLQSKVFDKKGNIASCEVSLSLQEYGTE